VDLEELLQRVSNLIAAKDFDGAEKLLLEAKQAADLKGDAQAQNFILSELIELYYCVAVPPLFAKAEALSSERERLAPSAYAELETAMILHYGARDYARAIPKLEAAIAKGKAEGDDRTVYTSLSLLGQACLEVSQTEKALAALREIEKMVANKASFVAGDETNFLEGLLKRGLKTNNVRHLASTLASVCRDPNFRKRLRELAGDD
jgi:tetratricopeptide (TPR) repeat protein